MLKFTDFLFLGEFSPRLPSSATIEEITSSSATIQWMLIDPYTHSRPETFIVSYGVTSEQLNISTLGVTSNSTSQIYSTQLVSLQPGTEYFYRIDSRNQHETLRSSIMSFITKDGRELNHVLSEVK